MLPILPTPESINAIASQLFILNGQKAGINYLSFRQHFEALEKFLKERQTKLVSEEERDLITKLLVRFEEVRLASEANEMRGTFEDLKNGHLLLSEAKGEAGSELAGQEL